MEDKQYGFRMYCTSMLAFQALSRYGLYLLTQPSFGSHFMTTTLEVLTWFTHCLHSSWLKFHCSSSWCKLTFSTDALGSFKASVQIVHWFQLLFSSLWSHRWFISLFNISGFTFTCDFNFLWWSWSCYCRLCHGEFAKSESAVFAAFLIGCRVIFAVNLYPCHNVVKFWECIWVGQLAGYVCRWTDTSWSVILKWWCTFHLCQNVYVWATPRLDMPHSKIYITLPMGWAGDMIQFTKALRSFSNILMAVTGLLCSILHLQKNVGVPSWAWQTGLSANSVFSRS